MPTLGVVSLPIESVPRRRRSSPFLSGGRVRLAGHGIRSETMAVEASVRSRSR